MAFISLDDFSRQRLSVFFLIVTTYFGFLSFNFSLVDSDFFLWPDLFGLLLAGIASNEKFRLIRLHKVLIPSLWVEYFTIGGGWSLGTTRFFASSFHAIIAFGARASVPLNKKQSKLRARERLVLTSQQCSGQHGRSKQSSHFISISSISVLTL